MMDRGSGNRDIMITYGQVKIPCVVKRSNRKSYSIEIDENGTVLLKVPLHPSERFIQEFLRDKEAWIIEKYQKQMQRKQQFNAWRKEFGCTPEQEAALTKRYRRAAKEYIPKRVAYYHEIMGGAYEKIVIREQKTRWGSCSSNGTLSFNWRLMLAPPAVLDYVVVHELAHLQEMNHSKAFWQVVEDVMPDYRTWRTWLKENGMRLQMMGKADYQDDIQM